MSIDNSILNSEISSIINSSFYPTNYVYTAKIKIEAEVFDIMKIIEIDEHSDYEYTYGPIKVIKILVAKGDYANIIYPNRDKLELMLTTEKVNHNDYSALDEEDSIETIIYNARLDPDSSPIISSDINTEYYSREESNLMGLVEIKLQIKPKLLDDISKISIGGQFLNITNIELLKNIITFYCSELNLQDDYKLLGINVQGTPSEVIKKRVIIPHGLKLHDLADYLQHKQGGVFSTGLAQFVYKRWWYIFSAYDTTDYENGEDKIVIISVPQKRYPQITKSWIKRNNIITILATGNRKVKSNKLTDFDNIGNGVMFTDANKIIDGFQVDKGNIAILNRGKNNSEFAGEGLNKNHLTTSSNAITSNPFSATSRLAKSQGHYFTFEWQNCDPEVIKPGMKIKIQYLSGDEVIELNGILLKAHIQTILNGQGMVATGHRTHAAMVVFVKAEEIHDGDLLGLN